MDDRVMLQEEPSNPTVAHEDRDINVRAILWFTLIFIVVAAVIHVAMWGLFKLYAKMERDDWRPPLTQLQTDPNRLPEEPLLQPFPVRHPDGSFESPLVHTPVNDMAELLRQERLTLSTYGWADRDRQSVRIPIEQAMKAVVARGLPVITPSRSGTSAAAATPAGGGRPAEQRGAGGAE